MELLEGEEEDVLRLGEHTGPHEPSGLLHQGPLVDGVPADDAVLRVLAVAGEGPDPVDHPLGLLGLPLPVGQGPQTGQDVPLLLPRLLQALPEAPLGGARAEVPDVVEDRGHERGGALAPARPRDVDLADAAHAVPVEVGLDGVARPGPARELRQPVREVVVLDALQERHHLRMGADRVRDVEQVEAHLRGDVAGGGERERVGRVLLAQPCEELVVEPPGGLHARHERPEAQRVGEDPLVLLEGFEEEVEQLRSAPGPDVALQGGDGRPAALDQFGDNRRVGVDRGGRGAGYGCGSGRGLVREGRDEVAAVEDGLQGVPDQRVALPDGLQEGGAARGRGQAPGDVHEQPPAGLVHRHHGRQPPHGVSQGLHGVGHHLLVADRDVDVVVRVLGPGHGEQRGDRPTLDDPEVVVHQAPLDVLRAAEVRLDPPAEPHEPQDLLVRQRRALPPPRVDLHLPRAAAGQGPEGARLGGDRLGDDPVVPHGEDVRVHQAGDQGLAEPEAGVHRGGPPVARDGVGREEDAGRVGEGHPLDDHGHADRAVVDAVVPPVGDGPLGEQRGPAPADVPEDLRRAHDVQIAVLLAGEGGRRQVLRRGAGADGVGVVRAEPGEGARDRLRDVVRDGGRLDGTADLRAERTEPFPVVRVRAGQPVEQAVERRRPLHDPPEGVRRHAEAGRHADAVEPRQRAQVRALAADERDPRLVDLLEVPHVPRVHRAPFSAGRGRGRRFCAMAGALPQAPRCAIP